MFDIHSLLFCSSFGISLEEKEKKEEFSKHSLDSPQFNYTYSNLQLQNHSKAHKYLISYRTLPFMHTAAEPEDIKEGNKNLGLFFFIFDLLSCNKFHL